MNIPYVMKKCTCCGRWLVASTDNFRKAKRGKYGLRSQCKACEKEYYEQNRDKISVKHKKYREENKDKILAHQKEYQKQNKDKILAYQKEHYKQNKEKISAHQKEYREENKDKILAYHKKYQEENKDKILAYQKEYYEQNRDKVLARHEEYRKQNKDKILARQKEYYEQNRDKILARHEEYRKQNKDKIATRQKEYYEQNRDKISVRHEEYRKQNIKKFREYSKKWYNSPKGQASNFNRTTKRRAKEQAQGNGITTEQWRECMSFFDWKCAYSGETLTKDNRSIDHIVPLDAGGDNMIWNCVPMTRSLNSSKWKKDMLEWYEQQSFYDPKRLQKIYKWQEYAYNKYGKDTDYFNTNDIQITLL